MIKAIDTKYDGCLFRSRLEARFAVYFNYLGVEWLYEPEGFELGINGRYLPDFFFPKFKLYAEVKPIKFNYLEHSKCRRLANLTQCNVIELVGIPHMEMYNVIIPSRYFICPIYGQEYVYSDYRSEVCKCGQKHKIFNSVSESEASLVLASPKESFMPLFFGEYPYGYEEYDNKIKSAIIAAKSARFEFGHKN
jgi:hypothetical protein